jgi:hypothetical protein
MIVRHIPVDYCAQVWPNVTKYIADAQQYAGDDYTVDQVKGLICSGQWMLLVAVDEQGAIHGAAAVNFINMPNDRIAFITFIGGKLVSSKDTYAQMVQIFKQFGATKIQGAVRESMAIFSHRYGFEERYRIVEAKL